MTSRQETVEFIRALELSANRKLNYPDVVRILIESARRENQTEVFEELVFLAKFLTKSFGVMQRIGVDGEGYDKLSAEFKLNMEKVVNLLTTHRDVMKDDADRTMLSRFFSMTPRSLDDLMMLLNDLMLVKNWMLDGKKIP